MIAVIMSLPYENLNTKNWYSLFIIFKLSRLFEIMSFCLEYDFTGKIEILGRKR